MKLEDKSKEQLIREIKSLQKQLEKLKKSQTRSKETEKTLQKEKLKKHQEQLQREVQERIQVEEALRESEQSLRALLNATSDAAFLMDPDGTLIALNEATTKAFSKRVDEVIGCNAYDLLLPNLAKSRKAKVQQVIRSGKPIRFEDQHTDRWLDNSIYPIFDTAGKVVRLAIFGRNITEQKRAEEALRRSEQKFFKAFHSSPCIMAISTMKEGRFIDVNESFSRITGYARDEVIGRTSTELKLYAEKEDRERLIQILNKEGMICNIEIGVRIKSGEIRIGLFSAEPVEIDNDRCLLTVLDDITDRKQAENGLRKSDIRFRSMIEHTSDSVFCYEYSPPIPTNIPIQKQIRMLYDGILVECNDLCARSYGAKRVEEVLGRKLTENFGAPPGSLDEFFHHFIKDGYKMADGEGEETLEDGTKRYFINNGSGIIEDGKLVRIWGTYRDITDRKSVEEKLQFTQFSMDHAGEAAFWMGYDARFIYVNEKACRSLGYGRGELLSMTVHDIDPNFPKEIWEDHWKEVKQKGTLTIESHHRTKDGIVFPVEITVNYLDFKGREYNCVFARNIMVRKQTEEALRRYAETQAVLLREVNHRVKNNLSDIISMLHKEEDKARKDKVTSHLPVLQSLEGRIHGLSTVHSMLSVSEWQPLKLTELCNQVIRAGIQSVPSTKKIDLEITSSTIKVNSNQAHHLTLVINELLTNTIKHVLGDRESVTIGVRINKQKEEVKMCFYDDGPGFPPSMPKRDFSKLGVGFDLIQGIVRKNLKGNIHLMNRRGARVYIQFQHE